MSRLIMWNLVTLDGFFEGAEKWDIDWHEHVWGEELEAFSLEQLRSADRLVFGRVTYEGMAPHWSSAKGEIAELMRGLPKVVFSRTLQKAEWANTTLARDPLVDMPRLKGEGENNSFVFGSGSLSETLTQHGLFDEYRLCMVPVVLGRGTPLFGRGLERRHLRLLRTQPMGAGCVVLHLVPSEPTVAP